MIKWKKKKKSSNGFSVLCGEKKASIVLHFGYTCESSQVVVFAV